MARATRGWNPESNGERNKSNNFSFSLSDDKAAALERLSHDQKRRIPDILRSLVDAALANHVTAADGSPTKNATNAEDVAAGKGQDPLSGEPRKPAPKP